LRLSAYLRVKETDDRTIITKRTKNYKSWKINLALAVAMLTADVAAALQLDAANQIKGRD